jgi:hypothetical protein
MVIGCFFGLIKVYAAIQNNRKHKEVIAIWKSVGLKLMVGVGRSCELVMIRMVIRSSGSFILFF